MEFTKDICFNDNLRNGQNATVTYSGELFRNGSQNVNIVFGFGENWHYTTTLPMQKSENGFSAEIEIKDFDSFNFCFSNENGNWDNNNSLNYVSPILPNVVEQETEVENLVEEEYAIENVQEVEQENTVENIVEATAQDQIDYGTDYSASIDDIIEDILGNTVQNDLANNNESESIDKILESITEETLPEIEQLFNELFAPELDDIEPIQEIEETKVEEFEDIKLDVENNVVNQLADDTNAKLIKLFNELFESAIEPNHCENAEIAENIVQEKQEAKLNISSFNLDGLVSELLEPVISKASIITEEEKSLFEDINTQEEEETSLTVLESNNLLVSPRRLSNFYKVKKKIKIACYKLFVKIPRQLVKQLGFGKN